MLKALANEEAKDEQLALASESSNLKWMLKADLLELYRSEERDFIQKNKLNWLKLGDENTKFFHRFLAAKKEKNLISELVNDQVVRTSSYVEIEGLILDFYRLLYTKAPQAGHFSSLLNCAVVSNDQNKSLTSEFSVEEIKSALKLLGRSKAPGPDGFTAEFLIKFWDELKSYFHSRFKKFYASRKLDARLCRGSLWIAAFLHLCVHYVKIKGRSYNISSLIALMLQTVGGKSFQFF